MSVRTALVVVLMPLLAACGSGDWVVTTWGEDYIEQGIPAADFVDGCSVDYDLFEVEFTSVTLLEVDETVVGDASAGRFDLTAAGPLELGSVPVPAGDYQRVTYVIGPTDGDAVRAVGAVTCGAERVTFDWSFADDTRYRCLPLDIQVPKGDRATTQLTIHGDHLFFDSLDEDGGAMRGEPIVAADADADGAVTLAELEAMEVATLGYDVGLYTDVDNLADFIARLVRGVGHVDGEGHCFVEEG